MSLKTPVQYPVRYYNNTMTDAPIISDADGSIKTIYKACLVTGFGSEAGAGWEMPFEDTNRMILRTPKRTGSPPDYKIEDGDVNGTYRNGISSYAFETATSLDDTNVIVDYEQFPTKVAGVEWHLFATDFGCLFYYSATRHARAYPRIMYFGGVKKLIDSDNEIWAIKTPLVFNNTYARPDSHFLKNSHLNANTNTALGKLKAIEINISPLQINNEDFFQRLLTDVPSPAEITFYASIAAKHSDILNNEILTSGTTQLLRLRENIDNDRYNKYYYVPLDFWEL